MPATYHVIPGNVWTRGFRRLSIEAKVTAFAVYTSPLRISEGLFELPAAHISIDTGLTVDQVDGALAELEEAGELRYDFDAELVLIPWALKASPLRHPRDDDGSIATRDDGSLKLDKRIRPAVRKLRALPDSPLKAVFLELAREHSPDLAEALEQGPPKGSTKAPPKAPSEGTTKGAPKAPTKGASREEKSKSKSKSASHEKEASTNGSSSSVNTACKSCGEPGGWCQCGAAPPTPSQRLAARVAGGAS